MVYFLSNFLKYSSKFTGTRVFFIEYRLNRRLNKIRLLLKANKLKTIG